MSSGMEPEIVEVEDAPAPQDAAGPSGSAAASSSSDTRLRRQRRRRQLEEDPAPPVLALEPPPGPEAAAEAPRRWVMLASVPRHHTRGGAGDLSFDVAQPPRVSVMRASPHVTVSSITSAGFDYPYIAAADASGSLLLCANHRSDWRGSEGLYWPHLYLCDAAAGTATGIKDLVASDVASPLFTRVHPGRIGVVCDGDGRVLVAHLSPRPGTGESGLLRFAVDTGYWVPEKLLQCARPNPGRPWGNNGVVNLGGRLWWIDLAHGLLTCDPFADEPVLSYVPLPRGCELPDPITPQHLLELEKSRFVRASQGALRFVWIHAVDGHPTVSMWTANPDPAAAAAAAGGDPWACNYDAPFAEIWADDSYKRRGLGFPFKPQLREEVPSLALVDPFNPDVLYFWQDNDIFAVDVPKRRVVERGNQFAMAVPRFNIPEEEFHSARSVHAWVLPNDLHEQLRGRNTSILGDFFRGLGKDKSVYGSSHKLIV